MAEIQRIDDVEKVLGVRYEEEYKDPLLRKGPGVGEKATVNGQQATGKPYGFTGSPTIEALK